MVLVEGEAGIGKSSLLASGLGAAAGRGMQIVTGRAEEMERSRPFGLLASLLIWPAPTPSFGTPRSAAAASAARARPGWLGESYPD